MTAGVFSGRIRPEAACMPLREDLYPQAEFVEPERQLHRHVPYHARKGDIVVVRPRDMTSRVRSDDD
jgi:hypothetical protein